jgi:hypothetical protein
METEIKQEIVEYIDACRRCNTTPENIAKIKAVLEDFAGFLKLREKVRTEKARLYFTSKL